MTDKNNLDLSAAFAMNTAIELPKWLIRAEKAIQRFYSTMKLWNRLCSHIQGLALPQHLNQIFPILKEHTHNFRTIASFCEMRPEMLLMLKTALIGVTYGSIQENKDDLSIFRYHYALDTAFDLMTIPASRRCHRPEFMTEGGQVEKALCTTIEDIFGIVLREMKGEQRGDYIDYMIYACTHFANTDANYSRAGKKAIKESFKNFYMTLQPDEKAEIKQSKFYKNNAANRALIDELLDEARNGIPVHRNATSQPSTQNTRERKPV